MGSCPGPQVSTVLQKGRPIIQAADPALASSWCHEQCTLDAAGATFICQPARRATERLAVQWEGSDQCVCKLKKMKPGPRSAGTA